jgi:hypothetical protein
MTELARALGPRRIAAFGLPDTDGAPLVVGEAEWPAFFGRVVDQRLTGLAVAGLEAGWLAVPDDGVGALLDQHRRAMVQALALERTLLRLVEACEASALPVVVLKGPALAHTMYPDPSWRPFVDVDLLVGASDWRRACSLLAELGFRRRTPEPRPGFDERFGKAAAHRNDDGLEVDLHRTLVVGPFGLWMEPDLLFRQTTVFELGGQTLRRLDDTMLLLHGCMHASLGWAPPLLLPVRDVAQIAASADVDWGLLAGLARRWRLVPVIRHAFQSASELLEVGWPLAARMVLAVPPRRRERRVLEAYTTRRRRRGATALATMRAIRGVGGKAVYARDLLFPGREFLAARTGGGRRALLRRWAVPLRWLRAHR